ncbi:hypothetical protein D3C73_970470 [compost metagenome]
MEETANQRDKPLPINVSLLSFAVIDVLNDLEFPAVHFPHSGIFKFKDSENVLW